MTLDTKALFRDAWDAEIQKRRADSPSYAIEDYVVTGRAPAPYGKMGRSPSGLRPPCVVDGCDNPRNGRGLCNKHYERWRKHGTVVLQAKPGIIERIAAKFEIGPGGCWLWTAGHDGKYGVMHHEGRHWKAHRLLYTLLIGEVPKHLDLDHLCRNTRCINPAHLEPVTRSENLRRGAAARKAEVAA